MNGGTVAQGVTITVVGMGLVFLVLGLLVLAMLLMGRVLRPRQEPAPREPSPPAGPPPPDRARVAVLAAAIALSRAAAPSGPAAGWAAVVEGDALGAWQARRPTSPPGRPRPGDRTDAALSNRP